MPLLDELYFFVTLGLDLKQENMRANAPGYEALFRPSFVLLIPLVPFILTDFF